MKKLFSNSIFMIVLVAGLAGAMGFAGVSAMTASKHPITKHCSGQCVELTIAGMQPNTLSVKVGGFVQFNANDGRTHNISLGKGADETGEEHGEEHHEAHAAPHEHEGTYASGDFGNGEAWRVQFKQVGTYRLHDHHHPELEILVVVYDPAKPSTIQ